MNIKKWGMVFVGVLASTAVINAVPQLKQLSNSGNKYFN
jgi:hypothetical protein